VVSNAQHDRKHFPALNFVVNPIFVAQSPCLSATSTEQLLVQQMFYQIDPGLAALIAFNIASGRCFTRFLRRKAYGDLRQCDSRSRCLAARGSHILLWETSLLGSAP